MKEISFHINSEVTKHTFDKENRQGITWESSKIFSGLRSLEGTKTHAEKPNKHQATHLYPKKHKTQKFQGAPCQIR